MNSRHQQLTAVVCACIATFLGGCAANLTEAERYDRQAAYEEKRDLIHAFVNNCETAGHVVMYTGPTTHKLRNPVKYVPRHARSSDYKCVTAADIERFQLQM